MLKTSKRICRECGVTNQDIGLGGFVTNHRCLYNKSKICKTCAQEYKKNRQLEYRKRVYRILHNQGCSVCDFNDPRALEFHHLNPENKEFNVAEGINWTISWERMEKEMEKCDVLCANCHKIEHAPTIDFKE